MIVQHLSKSKEWITPPEYVRAARVFLGTIDLDPASSEYANKLSVQATRYYTVEDDGLARAWFMNRESAGTVWLNPPYGYDFDSNGKKVSSVSLWVKRLLSEFDGGFVTRAVLLVNATPAQKWFAPLWRFPICFPDHRVRFIRESDGKANQPTHSNCLVGVCNEGWEISAFHDAFKHIGPVAMRLRL